MACAVSEQTLEACHARVRLLASMRWFAGVLHVAANFMGGPFFPVPAGLHSRNGLLPTFGIHPSQTLWSRLWTCALCHGAVGPEWPGVLSWFQALGGGAMEVKVENAVRAVSHKV